MPNTTISRPMTTKEHIKRLENENRINRAMLGRDITRRTNNDQRIHQEIWANYAKIRRLKLEREDEEKSA